MSEMLNCKHTKLTHYIGEPENIFFCDDCDRKFTIGEKC